MPPTLHPDTIAKAMEPFLAARRPQEDIRAKVDIWYRVKGSSVILVEIRPRLDLPEAYHESAFAKATYVKSTNKWKVYWMRASGKWERYEPRDTVPSLAVFLRLVDEDALGCFFG